MTFQQRARPYPRAGRETRADHTDSGARRNTPSARAKIARGRSPGAMRLGAGPTAMTTRLIGARVPRNEDPRLLRGLGSFVDDIEPRGVLHAACLRAPYAHARIAAIDAARARALPGVHLVLTAADLGELNQPSPLLIPHPGLTHPRTQRPLATDEVRYTGELVAFVVADDRYVAEDAVGLIDVAVRAAAGRDRARGAPPSRGRRSSTPTCPGTARRESSSGWATRTRPSPARPTSCRSGSTSSGAAAAPSRLAAWWRSTIPGPGSSACGPRRRRRSPSRTVSRGSSACRSSRSRSSCRTPGAASARRSCCSIPRRSWSRTRRCASGGP